jgi:hypothetical protein
VLIDGYHPSTAFYWISTRPATGRQVAYRLQVSQERNAPITVALTMGAPHDAITNGDVRR